MLLQLREKLKSLVSMQYEHPKLQKLMEVLHEHFASDGSNSRVIVFTSLRDTVFDIVGTLERNKHPSIKAKSECLLRWLPGPLFDADGLSAKDREHLLGSSR